MFWETFICHMPVGSCNVPVLQNGHYADQNGSVYAPEFPVPDTLELTPHCRTNYEVSKIGTVTCKDNVTVTCNKKTDSCPSLPLTSDQVSCHVSKVTNLYTCTLTCNHGYYIINTEGGKASLTETQTISCNSVTDVWSHQSSTGDLRWDTCSQSVPVSQYILSVNLTLTGGSCPTSTQLDSAINTWFNAQVHSAYTCIKNGTCSFSNRSGCESGSGGVVYSFTLLQTKNLESNLLTDLNTKLVQDVKAGSLTLSISTKKRDTTTLTSTSITTLPSTGCSAGAQAVGDICVKCGTGSYLKDGACTRCPIGKYSDEAGQVSCKSCTGNLTTLYTGSSSSSDCVYKCTVPELSNGVSVPGSGWFISNTTLINLSCNSGHSPGYKQPQQYTCTSNFSCYPQCQTPSLSSNQSYLDPTMGPGILIPHFRNISVFCLGLTDTVSCNAGTLDVPPCKPRVVGVGAVKVKSSTPAEVECKISALLHSVNISWYLGDLLITQDASYTINTTVWNKTTYNQSSTLKIAATKTDQDREFHCRVVGGDVNTTLSVNLDVFEITGKGARVNTGDSATLTCTITGSYSLHLVTWSRVGDVTLPSDVITSPGQWSSGMQIATLVQNNARNNGSFKCGVEDGTGNKHYVNIDLQVIPETKDPDGSSTRAFPSFVVLLSISSLIWV